MKQFLLPKRKGSFLSVLKTRAYGQYQTNWVMCLSCTPSTAATDGSTKSGCMTTNPELSMTIHRLLSVLLHSGYAFTSCVQKYGKVKSMAATAKASGLEPLKKEQ
eukprot:m.150936 g.150936  ORF g.150936 m.150936 type:complete len:105 (+) comp38558_c2_seq2:590-904(+)